MRRGGVGRTWKIPFFKVSVITYYFGCEHEGGDKKMVSRGRSYLDTSILHDLLE
jgi:hypothetical protein